VELATLSLLREQLSVFVGTPESLGERPTEWCGALRKLHVPLASITSPPM
jgi:hypothetical protein